ncbi:hypothetical protein Sjap_000407 [Stephania japonica]|uniref:Uncharacterized protein n=1 Tax=Stephania japonica TaxID=461633 RepID=A0AAP0KKC8_9MAGN
MSRDCSVTDTTRGASDSLISRRRRFSLPHIFYTCLPDKLELVHIASFTAAQ